VLDIDAEDSLEVPAVEDQEPVEALGADGADEALGDGVGFRCADWCAQNPDSLTAEDLVERPVYLLSRSRIRKRICCAPKKRPTFARLLRDPTPIRAGGTAAKLNATAAVLDEEENVEATYEHVSTVKKSQATMLAACWCRNSRQLGPMRRGAGCNRARANRRRILVGDACRPSLASSPQTRR